MAALPSFGLRMSKQPCNNSILYANISAFMLTIWEPGTEHTLSDNITWQYWSALKYDCCHSSGSNNTCFYCKTVRIFAYSIPAKSQTQGLDWGWKRRTRLRGDAKNTLDRFLCLRSKKKRLFCGLTHYKFTLHAPTCIEDRKRLL